MTTQNSGPTQYLHTLAFDADTLRNEHDEDEALAWLIFDPRHRLDVVDVARVYLQEGPGPVALWYDVIDQGRTLIMHVDAQSPARCRFSIAIPVPAAERVLLEALKLGSLVLMARGSSRATLEVHPDKMELIKALNQARTLREQP